MYEAAVLFAMRLLPTTSEREVRYSLFEDDRFGGWLRRFGHDDVPKADAIIAEAASRLTEQPK